MSRQHGHSRMVPARPWRRRGTSLALTLAMAGLGMAQAADRDMTVTKKAESGKAFKLGQVPVTVTLDLDEHLVKAIREACGADHSAKAAPRIHLRVDGLQPSDEAWASGGRAFLNLGDTPDKLNPELLTTKSPHYAGSFAFSHPVGKEQGYYLSPTPALRHLVQRGELGKDKTLRLTLIGIPPANRGADSSVSRDDIPFTKVTLTVARPQSD